MSFLDRAELCQPTDHHDFAKIAELVNGVARRSTWVPLSMEVIREDEGKKLAYADILTIGNADTPIFRRKAIEALEGYLCEYGELLPLNCAGADVMMYNVTNVLDVLDVDRSAFIGGQKREESALSKYKIAAVDSPIFREFSLEENDIFRLPEHHRSIVYVTHRFVERWKDTKLKGLKFINTADMTKGWWMRGNIAKI